MADDPRTFEWERWFKPHYVAWFLVFELVVIAAGIGFVHRLDQQHTSRDVAAAIRQAQLQLALIKQMGDELNTHATASADRSCAQAAMDRYVTFRDERNLTKEQRQKINDFVTVACSYTLPGGRSSICLTPGKAASADAAIAAIAEEIPHALSMLTDRGGRRVDRVKAYVFHREGSTHRSKKIPYGGLDDALDARLEAGEGPYRLGKLRPDGSVVKDSLTNWRTSNEAVRYFPPRLKDAHIGSLWRIESKTRPRWGLRIRVRELTPGERAVMAARTQLNVPYVWGAEQPNVAFDCSGLTSWAWSVAGVSLPHNAEAQRQVCDKVSTPRQGDLVEMDYNGTGSASHVGLWVSPGRMIDTRNPNGEPVEIRSIEMPYLMGYYRPPGA